MCAQACLTLGHPQTIAQQAPLSLGFPREEYWNGLLPCPPPGDLPTSGTESMSLAYPALAGKFFTFVPPGKPVLTVSSDGKESACNVGDLGLIPGLERSPGEGNGNPLQCSCLENPRDRGAQWAAVYGVTQRRTQLKQLSSSSTFSMFCNCKLYLVPKTVSYFFEAI